MKPRRRPEPAEKWGAGDPEKWRPLTFPDGTPQRAHLGLGHGQAGMELVFGEHPHSRDDHNIYALDLWNEEHAIAFSGHRIAVALEIRERNYLKSFGLSGSEFRGGCSLLVRFNGRIVYGESFHRADQACAWWLANAHKLFEHSCQLWWGEGESFPDVVGRKVYWRDTPGVIRRYIPDQGAVIITYDGPKGKGRGFRTPAHRSLNDEEELGAHVKDNLLSESIWWFRE